MENEFSELQNPCTEKKGNRKKKVGKKRKKERNILTLKSFLYITRPPFASQPQTERTRAAVPGCSSGATILPLDVYMVTAWVWILSKVHSSLIFVLLPKYQQFVPAKI